MTTLPCAWHRPENLTGEVATRDAEARIKNKQQQYRCTVCNMWFWREERGSKPAGINQRWKSGPRIKAADYD